jgi:hypothetical protein
MKYVCLKDVCLKDVCLKDVCLKDVCSMTKNIFRHPEVRAMSAVTRVFDALWRASKGDGHSAAAGILRGPLRSYLTMTV